MDKLPSEVIRKYMSMILLIKPNLAKFENSCLPTALYTDVLNVSTNGISVIATV